MIYVDGARLVPGWHLSSSPDPRPGGRYEVTEVRIGNARVTMKPGYLAKVVDGTIVGLDEYEPVSIGALETSPSWQVTEPLALLARLAGYEARPDETEKVLEKVAAKYGMRRMTADLADDTRVTTTCLFCTKGQRDICPRVRVLGHCPCDVTDTEVNT